MPEIVTPRVVDASMKRVAMKAMKSTRMKSVAMKQAKVAIKLMKQTAKQVKRQSKSMEVEKGEKAAKKKTIAKTKKHQKVDETEEDDEHSEEEKDEDDEHEDTDARREWPALESSAEGFTKYMRRLGASKCLEFHDVLGLDDELLDMLPKTVVAMILLFPINDGSGESMMPITARRNVKVPDKSPYFVWQNADLGNACGCLAILHGLANIGVSHPKSSLLSRFFTETKNMTPKDRGNALENSEELKQANDDIAHDDDVNQTNALGEGDDSDDDEDLDADYHFITFVKHTEDSCLYELDGCRNVPLRRAENVQNFPQECAKVIRKHYMERAPASVHFNLLALCNTG